MGSIRKQTILSSLLMYAGFLVGVINTYFYIKNGSFTPEQFGLTRFFFDFGQNMYVFASMGVIPVIYKFYPYYKDNLEEKKNDLITWAMVVALIGFLLVMLAGWYLEPLFIRKYTRTSKLVVDFYFWVFPFALGMLFFSVLEGFCWALQKTVITNFLKEAVMRCITSVFILLYYFKLISFTSFIHLFSLLYLFIFLFLLLYLLRIKKMHVTFIVSRVTKKFHRKMISMQSLVFAGSLIATFASTLDSFIIAGFQNLAAVGIFGLALYVANTVQIPLRSIQSISSGVLSRAWKDKNLLEIARIYQRSSINLLLISMFIFGNIWLNVRQGMEIIHIQKDYQSGLYVILILGLSRIVDAGTGVNGVVISTSTFWKFDFFCWVILLSCRLPLAWLLIKHYGIIGSAIADLAAMSVYNFIRFEFLKRKFNMQPFNTKTLYGILLAVVSYGSCYLLLNDMQGWIGILLRISLFSGIMIIGIFYLNLTPDATQLYQHLRKKSQP
jgi:O-antigen/teichoic acid export membrane protein